MKTAQLILVLLFVQISFGQVFSAKFIEKISLKADQFVGMDDLQNIYYIKGNTLFKKGKKETLSYANVVLGKIESVDIQNPFKIILFYKDFNSVVFLDNKLNELSSRIDFTKETAFYNVLFVSHSSENNLWLYADDSKLHLYDFQNRFEKLQTQPLTFYEPDFICKQLLSTFKDAFVVGNLGVLQFNQYGNFIHYFKLKNSKFISLFKEGFIYVTEGEIFYQDLENSYPLNINFDDNCKGFYINNAYITIFDGITVSIYELL